jgi:NADPH:quinone reductase-like Zn-dependent oxidoreductase
MKAVICEKYGPPEVLAYGEIDRPVPGPGEVLVKVHASSVNAADCNCRGFTYVPSGLGFLARMMLGYKKPKLPVLGSVLSGLVEEIGEGVSTFRKEDKVYGTGPEMGAYAEYAIRKADGAIALMPENLDFEEAATVPYGALTALYFIRDAAGIKKGQKVLVIGASGGVGMYAVQLAKYFEAEVTGVCSTKNVEFVRSMGADRVIDYSREDIIQTGKTWDIIVDIVVRKTSFRKVKKILNTGGKYLAIAGGLNDMLQMVLSSFRKSKKVIFGGGAACEKKENLEFLSRLIEQNALKVHVDKTFNFDEIVEAHHYVEAGSKQGNIALKIC